MERIDDETLAKQLVRLFKKHEGNAQAVADALGVAYSSLQRRVRRLKRDGFDVREMAGTPSLPGRRPKTGRYRDWRKKHPAREKKDS